MADKVIKGGKKSRKHGRNRRKPCKMRYTSSKRWILNKAKKVWKYMRKHQNWRPTNLGADVNLKIKELSKGG